MFLKYNLGEFEFFYDHLVKNLWSRSCAVVVVLVVVVLAGGLSITGSSVELTYIPYLFVYETHPTLNSRSRICFAGLENCFEIQT